MSGHNPHTSHRLRDEVAQDYQLLDRGCRSVGVTATMFRIFKFLFYIVTLGTTVYLIQYAGVEPIIAMMFAILLISGPEGLETWLIERGRLQDGQEDDGEK
jgi:hypothetical protein